MKRREKISRHRREFLKASLFGIAAVSGMQLGALASAPKRKKCRVALIKTKDRKKAVREVLRLLDVPPLRNKKVMVKPNFNTADPFPASTHNDTLVALVQEVKARGAASITVGERSGPPPTQKVMEEKGIFVLARELGFHVLNFEELAEEDWVHFSLPGHHWPEGFDLPRAVIEADVLLSTCCLKTHQFGGVFTMSLKLAVGLTPKKLMRTLHRSPAMRKMIAEINAAYSPQLIVMDGLEVFVDGGPSSGTQASADVFVAGTDRIGVDAVGLAVLKELGSNEAIMGTRIFAQEQIQRAVELNLGISDPRQVELVTPDRASRLYAEKLRTILEQG
ncbi:MAG: DUF362 domain-containing protein [Candidatus Aminicenantales bacterium]